MADLILPWINSIREASEEPASDPKCPAAKLGNYADSGRQYLFCGVERRHFAVQESPLAVHGWCCGEYTTCPVWVAMKENDPALERQQRAQQDLETAAQTKRQIETGVRVDDSDERQFREDFVAEEDK